MDGVIGDRRVGRSDSIWTIPLSRPLLLVEGQVGVIRRDENAQCVYHTVTGELQSYATQAHQHLTGSWFPLTWAHYGQDYLCHHNFPRRNTPPEDNWQVSRATVQKGWVKDPEGKHRLWVPIEWRMDWDPLNWLHDVTTQFSYLGDKLVLIKF